MVSKWLLLPSSIPTVLTTGLDLLDLSEPVSQTQTKAKKSESSSKSSSLKKKADGSDLISADAEQRAQALRGPETSSLDLGKAKVCSSYGLICLVGADMTVKLQMTLKPWTYEQER